MCIAQRAQRAHRLLPAVLLLGLLVWGASGCGGEATSASGSAGGWGASDAVSGSDGGMVYDDASASDAGGSWGGGADTSAGGWGASDTSAAEDTSGPDEDDAGGQSWQQTSDSPPVAQVSLGGGNTLELVSMRVAVRVEGLRARVLVDHIFKNPHPKVIEGTFRYTLPPESSVSYFAMFEGQSGAQPAFFGSGDGLGGSDQATIAGTTPITVVTGADKKVWGTAKVAKIQRHIEAVQVYEKETEKKIDPALVEAVAPNTFSAKVYPIPANGHNRILIAWEQTLPSMPKAGGGRVYEYVFPVPKGDLESFDFTLLAKKAHITAGKLIGNTTGGVAAYKPGELPKDVTETTVTESATKAGYLARMVSGSDTGDGTLKGGKLAFHFDPALGSGEADVLVGSDPVLNKDYATLRLRPQIAGLQAGAKATSKHAVFLLDTSRSSHPLRFGIALELMEKILTNSPTIESFNVIPFDSGASWLDGGWVPNDDKGRKDTLAAFDGLLLEGASDVGAALRTLTKPTWPVPAGTAVDVFLLTDGAVTWGERSMGALLARLKEDSKWDARFFAYRLGLGAENLQLFSRLTANGGAIFNCLSKAALPSCAKAHTAAGLLLTSVTVEPDGADGGAIADLLIGGRQATLYPGANLLLTGPVAKSGKAKVVITGTLPGGKKLTHEIKVNLQPKGQLAARAWAEVAVGQLLDSGDDKLEGLAMALSQHYRVLNRLASFLLLENEATWKQYKLADESKKFQGQPLAKIIAAGLKLGADAFSTWARTVSTMGAVKDKLGTELLASALVSNIVSAVGKSGMELPAAKLAWGGMPKKGLPNAYLQALLSKNLDLVMPFTKEAERRRGQLADLPGAVRALSTSIERNPGNDEMTRLAAYRLATWGLTDSAGELLFSVLLRRPFEPQSWRDLANAIAQSKPGLAMVLYEAALAGKWNAKWKTMKTVIAEEYALFAHHFVASQPKHDITPVLQTRIKTLNLKKLTGDLRVTATWNTNATDIDLWVTSPNGEKCFFSHKKLSTGGGLLDDLTQGYGPERFQVQKAMPGDWKIEVQYFANHGNKLVAETWVNVTIVQDMGSGMPAVSHHTVVLSKSKEVKLVDTVTFK